MDSGDIFTIAILGVIGYAIYASVGGGSPLCALFGVSNFPCGWNTSANAQQYVPTIESIGANYGLPSMLLSAVAYAESDFNPNAVSSAGAVGMFQLEPCYYPGAGQNWQTDAATAAQALSGYATQYQDWQLALAAYNWGPGNLGCGVALSCMPTETQQYVTKISDAISLPGSLVA